MEGKPDWLPGFPVQIYCNRRDNVAVAESRKRANVKWDAENMTTLGCRVKKEQADRFKAYCSEIGKTSNAVLRDYVLDCIGEKQDTE